MGSAAALHKSQLISSCMHVLLQVHAGAGKVQERGPELGDQASQQAQSGIGQATQGAQQGIGRAQGERCCCCV